MNELLVYEQGEFYLPNFNNIVRLGTESANHTVDKKLIKDIMNVIAEQDFILMYKGYDGQTIYFRLTINQLWTILPAKDSLNYTIKLCDKQVEEFNNQVQTGPYEIVVKTKTEDQALLIKTMFCK